jgi:N-acetylglucosamine-6-phosphate deacetylase
VSAGAKLSTHLGNGSHPLLPRHENYIWEQLASDELAASVIADGHHLPDSMLKVIARAKPNLILISDASPLAGQPPGRYQQWGADLVVEASGRIGVAGTPFLAGSGAFLDECVQYMMSAAKIPWREAIQMASVNPRKLLGIPVPTLTLGVPWSFQALPRGSRL